MLHHWQFIFYNWPCGRGGTPAQAEVIRYFKEVDNLPAEDKSALLRVIGGFLRDVKTKKAYAS